MDKMPYTSYYSACRAWNMRLWDIKARPPPMVNGPPKAPDYSIDYTDSQLPVLARRLFGGFDKWVYVESFTQLPPHHHEVDFGLTHKADFRIVRV